MEPLVSIIVPIYKVEKYLDKCVESIVNQTYKNLEIILVDDGSPDNCPAMCDAWAEKDNRIKVIHKRNGGLPSARNAGLEICSGDYISFVDSDDWIDNDTIDTALSAADEHGADITMFDCYYEFLEADTELRRTECFFCEGKDILKSFLCDIIRPEVCNKLYRSELIGDFRFDEKCRYSEDDGFNFEMMKRSKAFFNVGQCKYHYLQNSGNSLTTAWITDARAGSYRVTKAFIENLENSELRKYAVWRHVRFTYGLISRVVTSSDRRFYDTYFSELRNEILEYKSDIFSQNLYSAKHKIATIVLALSPGTFSKYLRRKTIR